MEASAVQMITGDIDFNPAFHLDMEKSKSGEYLYSIAIIGNE
jgi:hypothetical protein